MESFGQSSVSSILFTILGSASSEHLLFVLRCREYRDEQAGACAPGNSKSAGGG